MEQAKRISEGQTEFRPKRNCVDHVYTLGKIIQGWGSHLIVHFYMHKRPTGMAQYM